MPRHHPLVATFPSNDIVEFAMAQISVEDISAIRQGRGPTVRFAMLDLAARMENLAAEIRAAAERIP